MVLVLLHPFRTLLSHARTRLLAWAHCRQRVLCWAHRLCCALVQFFGGAYFVLYCFSAHAHVGMHHYKHVGMHHSSDPASPGMRALRACVDGYAHVPECQQHFAPACF
jgi:hypothetical protein